MSFNFSTTIGPMTKYKIVFLGDVYVGKTSLITRFMYDTFDANYHATVGIDFLSKTVYLDNKTVRLQLWDTAGQERFRSLIPNYIRDSYVAVIMFDVTDKQTFFNIDKWASDVFKERENKATLLVVGNKSDLTAKRQVSFQDATEKANELNAVYMETSAKTGSNIEEIFKHIAYLLPDHEKPSNGDIEIQDIRTEAKTVQTSLSNNCKC